MIGTAAAIGLGLGGAALGGIAGAIPKKTTSSVDAGGASPDELKGLQLQNDQLTQLQSLTNAGPGQADVTRSLASQRGLAALLQQYAQSGGLPSSADISTTNSLAGNLFAARRTALNQEFQDQDIATQQLAARLNRTSDDPILRARLLTQRSRAIDSLNAEQQGFGTQLALGLADRRVGFAQGAAGVDAALAAQAQTNRAALLGIGSNIAQAERNFRLGTATRTGESGGGFGGAIGGALGGFGGGLGLASAFSNLFPAGSPGGNTVAGYNPNNPIVPWGGGQVGPLNPNYVRPL
jgi:hypothetical protein